MVLQHQSRIANAISVAYFSAVIIELIAELYYYTPVILVFKPLMPALLMLLYFTTSNRRNPMYFIAMALSVLTNLLFIPNDSQMLFFGIIAFMFHRIFILILIYKLLALKDYIPVAIATIPLLLVFFYLLAISTEIPENSYVLLVIQNILISVLGGFALSNYMMSDTKKNSWLLISGLLFVALQFIVFLEKYYLIDLSPTIFRPIAMGLNGFAFYTFYEFVMAMERSDDYLPADG